MLAFYRNALSPLMQPSCRYLPTCSNYSIESYKRFGKVFAAAAADPAQQSFVWWDSTSNPDWVPQMTLLLPRLAIRCVAWQCADRLAAVEVQPIRQQRL